MIHFPEGVFTTEQWPGPSQLFEVWGFLVFKIGFFWYFTYGPNAFYDLATPTE